MEWKRTLGELPTQHQRVLVTDGRAIHVGVFYEENDKVVMESGLEYIGGGSYTDIENYTHWMPCPELP